MKSNNLNSKERILRIGLSMWNADSATGVQFPACARSRGKSNTRFYLKKIQKQTVNLLDCLKFSIDILTARYKMKTYQKTIGSVALSSEREKVTLKTTFCLKEIGA